VTALLIVLAVGFAWSIAAHYTGAVMGMPHALGAIGTWHSLLLMAQLAFLIQPEHRSRSGVGSVSPTKRPAGRRDQWFSP
jgi:PiT family inorganic phosphate transporter